MSEVASLLDRAETYIRSAELLLHEKDYDSSVSRSYYAMFFAAEAVLMHNSINFSSHKSVISLFGKHFVKTGIFKPKMGRILRRAYERRLVGDYSFSPQVGDEEAEEALGWAQEFVSNIKGYLK